MTASATSGAHRAATIAAESAGWLSVRSFTRSNMLTRPRESEDGQCDHAEYRQVEDAEGLELAQVERREEDESENDSGAAPWLPQAKQARRGERPQEIPRVHL